ncbi:hypothetical protein LWC34_12990 [Kibdelosporangium philippinense]|uniref:Uncharacterized protein n=1 Tax=Kibdelosporangium philippinense TaxID=211113 RepID=A0ABS8Z771_9PSEU|nr:hypothetical protein [Kibdelosporangium philippinense]MCE7003735.1 hypothetical protein [Kibdelosporangium philippinense]
MDRRSLHLVRRYDHLADLAEDYAVAENFDLSLAPESHDSLVAECLSFTTGSMSRTGKNFIDLAALHRHGISNPKVLTSGTATAAWRVVAGAGSLIVSWP